MKTEDDQTLQLQIRADGSKKRVSGLTIWIDLATNRVRWGCWHENNCRVPLCSWCSIFFAVGASETHADLIRNCLAMVFLVELDDLIYQGFTPSFGKEVIQDLPAIEVHSPVQGLPGSHYFHG